MQDEKFNRSLDGKERENERIAVKKNQNAVDKIDLEIKLNLNQIERLQFENEEKEKQIKGAKESIEIGKKLISGVKIKDAVPYEKLYGKPKPSEPEKKAVKEKVEDDEPKTTLEIKKEMEKEKTEKEESK